MPRKRKVDEEAYAALEEKFKALKTDVDARNNRTARQALAHIAKISLLEQGLKAAADKLAASESTVAELSREIQRGVKAQEQILGRFDEAVRLAEERKKMIERLERCLPKQERRGDREVPQVHPPPRRSAHQTSSILG